MKPLIIVCPTLKAAAENSLVTLGSKSSLYPSLNPSVRALKPKSFMNVCPSRIGKNSLYMTCCHSAFSIRLAF